MIFAPNVARLSLVKATPSTSNVPADGSVVIVTEAKLSPRSMSVKFKSLTPIERSTSSTVEIEATLSTSSEASSGVPLLSITLGASFSGVTLTVMV